MTRKHDSKKSEKYQLLWDMRQNQRTSKKIRIHIKDMWVTSVQSSVSLLPDANSLLIFGKSNKFSAKKKQNQEYRHFCKRLSFSFSSCNIIKKSPLCKQNAKRDFFMFMQSHIFQLARYFSCSSVNSSILIPHDVSFFLAITSSISAETSITLFLSVL